MVAGVGPVLGSSNPTLKKLAASPLSVRDKFRADFMAHCTTVAVIFDVEVD